MTQFMLLFGANLAGHAPLVGSQSMYHNVLYNTMALFDEPSRQPLPQPDFEDVQIAGRKSLVSMIPLIGGAGAELLALLSTPVGLRRDAWLEDLQRRLRELEQTVSGFSFDALENNERFVSATLQATQAALKTHQKEKLKALRNAILNIALGRSPEEDEEASFVGYIDELSSWHIRMLTFLQNPLKLVKERNGRTDYSIAGTISQALEEVYPELRGKKDFYEQIMRDLRTRGFIDSSENVLHTLMTQNGVFAKRTTQIADRFLKLIEVPDVEKP